MAYVLVLSLALAPAAAFISTPSLRQPLAPRLQAANLGSSISAVNVVPDSAPLKTGIATTAAEAVAALEAQGFSADATPGLDEDDRFAHVEPSVARWRAWRAPHVPSGQGGDGARVASLNLQAAAAAALAKATDLSASAQQRQYWTYHAGRLAFFAAQNLVVLALASNGPTAAPPKVTVTRAAGTGNEALVTSAGSPMLLDSRDPQEVAVALAALVAEAVATWEGDYESLERGAFAMPWDAALGLRHRQATPAFIFDKARRYVGEASGILGRRAKRTDAASRRLWKFPGAPPGGVAARPAAGSHGVEGPREEPRRHAQAVSKLYPDYYQNNFHFQTDGWMSADSAAVYETATESLFLGRQDAMQRGALLPLSRWANDRPTTSETFQLLEVACGTGRFSTFVRDSYPAADFTLSDLSPFYLEAARENQAYWERARGRDMGRDLGTVNFVQAAAEDLPFEDESYDAVLCVYLFHELPPAVRRAAAAEMARVLKPGGILVLTDSVQRGDRLAALDARLDMFTDLNEPYYSTYVRENLTAMLQDQGLEPDVKHVVSVSKTLSFRKPLGVS